MKRVLLMLLAMCLAFPVMAEPGEREPECWIVSHGCLTDFLQAWSEDNHEAMLALCAPSWKAQQADPGLALFLLLRNRTPVAWCIREKAAEDADRLYDVDILLEDYSGREPQWYRFAFRVALEDDVRCIDPDGMAAGEKTDTPVWYVTGDSARVDLSTISAQPDPSKNSWWVNAGYPDMWADHNARFSEFMELWGARDMEGVQTLITPGWAPKSPNPWEEMQRQFYIYTPDSYTIKRVAVAEDGKSVDYSVRIILASAAHELQIVDSNIIVYWMEDMWYIDPETLPQWENK